MHRVLTILFFFLSSMAFGQSAATAPHCINQEFHKEVASLLDEDVTLLDCGTLANQKDDYVILDAREKVEYDISHIPGAIWIGYDDFKISRIPQVENKSIVLYCSVGYRSEKIGQKLNKHGFENVFNLYGSIFESANRGFPLEDKNGKSTFFVHTYNRAWSKWVDDQKAEKVW